ncbi:HNH endonuclease family protein [Mycobacterium haemophilum]|uniref:Membrane protein n=1 Tax=Mycobacterium haemophilum TaxID=29311 RepID=A0A0I9YFX2_9MYCO|nr:HNH endonuclease family protein [Mycobacterium haemophilum]KLO33320.1 membrane protein [Mycobacterium haemophilum]KLO38842.1 membrane protein [Mycobacterium haemophilum]KLO45261.1 membrane protein [Mycobacterium haemophilum]KLO56412.1 membrane protein [Mycobacterium haemophilum]
MNRKVLLWLSAVAVLALVVAYQTLGASSARHADEFAARADMPRVHPGADVLENVVVLAQRLHRYDYHRSAFGDPWDDNNDAPLGHNGCDTRDDILTRDLVDKTFVSIKRCPNAVATGTLHDPYTNKTIAFHRGAKVGESVQIDHIVPLAYAWDMGAYGWPDRQRLRFANDPANLLAVDGQANQDKSDSPPARWMPPNAAFACQYAMQFIAVLRGYQLPVDEASTGVLRQAAATCPTG